MSLNITIKAPKIKVQQRKFSQVDASTKKHATTAMNQSVRLTRAGWKEVAAVDTGLYKNTLTQEVKPIAGNIIQGAVRTFAQSPTGFPYPRALEDSVRYHYRGTRRRGQRTAGQVTKMFKAITPTIVKLFAAARNKITGDMVVK